MNSNYLLRDDLVYELYIRGLRSEGIIQLLRKLRPVLSDDDPIELQNGGLMRLMHIKLSGRRYWILKIWGKRPA
jgi:hypothetical protein